MEKILIGFSKPLPLPLIEKIHHEVPQFEVVALDASSIVEWKKIEIFYGPRLEQDRLEIAENLSWIHTPTLAMRELPSLQDCFKKNIVVTSMEEVCSLEMSEILVGMIEGLMSHLLLCPKGMVENTIMNQIRTSAKGKNKLVAQIGWGPIAQALARALKNRSRHVISLSSHPTYRSFCDKSIFTKDLKSVLPTTDCLFVSYAYGGKHTRAIGVDELEHMKEKSCLVALDADHTLQLSKLIEKPHVLHDKNGILDIHPSNKKLIELLEKHFPHFALLPLSKSFEETVAQASIQFFIRNLKLYWLANKEHLSGVVSI